MQVANHSNFGVNPLAKIEKYPHVVEVYETKTLRLKVDVCREKVNHPRDLSHHSCPEFMKSHKNSQHKIHCHVFMKDDEETRD